MVKVRKDLTGIKFDRLTVIKQVSDYIYPSSKKHEAMWLCKCDCGNEVIVTNGHLNSGKIKSCGCLKKEVSKNTMRIKGKNNKKQNKYDLTGEYGIGYTSKGEEFYFDLEDYDKIKDYCWHINDSGYIVSMTTDSINSKRICILMHRIITDCPEDMVVDHINHNKNDNRKYNLRICSQQENRMNSNISKRNTSGYTGVYLCKTSNKWQAYITYNNNDIYLGLFNNKEDAIKARVEAEEKYFGKYKLYSK